MPCDVLMGIRPSFFIDGKEYYVSKLSRIAKVLFFLYLMFCIVFLSWDLITKKNPTLKDSQILNPDPEASNLGPNTFTIGCGLQHGRNFSAFYDPSIATIEYYQRIKRTTFEEDGTTDVDFQITKLEDRPCTADDFGDAGDHFGGAELDLHRCMEPIQSDGTKVTVGGRWESELYQGIQIKVHQCVNDTSNSEATVCRSPEDIQFAMSKL